MINIESNEILRTFLDIIDRKGEEIKYTLNDFDGGTIHTARFAFEKIKFVVAYKHDDKYLNEEQVQGNLKLLKNPNVIKLSSEEDINTIKLTIREIQSNNSYDEQINIFNYLKRGYLGCF